MRHIPAGIMNVVGYIAPHLIKTSLEGAQTSIYAALVNSTEVPVGSYLADCAIETVHPLADIKCLREELWNFSEKAVNA